MRNDERRTYERPTLTPAGSFKSITGLGGHGPKDMLVKHLRKHRQPSPR